MNFWGVLYAHVGDRCLTSHSTHYNQFGGRVDPLLPSDGSDTGLEKGCVKGAEIRKNLIVLKFGGIQQSSFFFFSSSATVVLRKIFSSTGHAVWLCTGLHAKDWLWEIEASEFPCGYLCNLARQKKVLSKLAGVVWNKKGESRFSRPELEKWW